MANSYKTDSGRRNFLKSIVCAGAAVAILPRIAFGAQPGSGGQAATKKPLVVYFSESGNTKKIAEGIHQRVGGDLVRIETVKPYPADYDTLTKVAKKEQEDKARPDINTKIPNIDEYGIIFLGYPNWWSSMPMPVYTFIEQNRLDGKTIAPFSTHGGGGLGHSIEDMKKALPNAKILKPLSVSGSRAGSAGSEILKWIEGLGPALIETTTGNTKIYPDGAY